MTTPDASVTEARALQQQGWIYVDVRSTAEFAGGHPESAVNVPLIEPDPDTGQPMPNADFVRVLQREFGQDAKLLVGCQVGGRSRRAAEMLRATGFSEVVNVRGGFMGARDPMGRTIDPGWVDAGLPIETGQPEGRQYADLAARADQPPR
jgi:rhodanese-related sulfurtransferase